MHPIDEHADRTRRSFLATSASGAGMLALSSLLREDGLLGAENSKSPHFAPKAKNCIFLFMAGAPSHVDLLDPKPKLNELDGQKLPESMLKKVRFAFIKKEGVTLMGSPRKFTRYGKSGTEFSDLIPNIGSCADDILVVRSMHTEQFNHHPGQLMMQCGRGTFGLPCMGSWVNYGLGSPSRNLPGYVVLTAGRGSSGGATLWQSGFLPPSYAGVRFRSSGTAYLVCGLEHPGSKSGCPDPRSDRFAITSHRPRNRRKLLCFRAINSSYGSLRCGSVSAVDLATGHDDPGDPRSLVGHGDGDQLVGLFCQQASDPGVGLGLTPRRLKL